MLALILGRTWPLFPVFHQFLEVCGICQQVIHDMHRECFFFFYEDYTFTLETAQTYCGVCLTVFRVLLDENPVVFVP